MNAKRNVVSNVHRGFAFLFGFVLLFLGMSSVEARVGEGHAWTHGDWSWRIAWEARYALSQAADGTSSLYYWDSSNKIVYYGDWDYANNDSNARDKAAAEGYGIVGSLGPNDNGHFMGGWCTFFVRLVLYRSSAWAYSDHLTLPNYPDSVYSSTSGMTQNYSSMSPGWVFIKPSGSPQHIAIADFRATVNGEPGWWVIDSNWVGSYYGESYVIGKHFLSDSYLLSSGYYGWNAARASYNQ